MLIRKILRSLRAPSALPDTITVIIPKQEYLADRYQGLLGDCYLKEALRKAGYPTARVSGYGFTTINGIVYSPSPEAPFSASIASEKMPHSDIKVILVKS